MLRNQQDIHAIKDHTSFSIGVDQSLNSLLTFVDRHIALFRPYYQANKDSEKENRISDFLCYYFNGLLRTEKEGFPPFLFGKNPTQAHTSKETDIGVVVLTPNIRPVTIIEFEAKRFSDLSNNKEYVCGERGGMERFKRSQHGSHLPLCGMFAYIQDRKYLNAAERVNTWIGELAQNNTDDSIDWTPIAEQLITDGDYTDVTKWRSLNTRKGIDSIILLHYHINLAD